MALAKRGSRRITVEGVVYRWAVSPDDGFMVLVVERAEAPGQRLEAFFGYGDIREPDRAGTTRTVGQGCVIGPGVVRLVVLSALANGWRPDTPIARAFRIRDGAQSARARPGPQGD